MIRRWLALTYYLYALRLAALSHFILIHYKYGGRHNAMRSYKHRNGTCRLPFRSTQKQPAPPLNSSFNRCVNLFLKFFQPLINRQ